MRAVVGAFDLLKEYRDGQPKETSTWLEHAKWFVGGLNKLVSEGWLEGYEDQASPRKRLLTQVVFDASGAIVNYKFQDAGRAFGTLVALLVVSRASDQDELTDVWQEYSENLRVPLRRGYRQLIRAELANRFEGTNVQFKNEVNRQADARVDEHLEDLKEYLGISD